MAPPGYKKLDMGLLGVLNSHSRELSSIYGLELTQKTLQKCETQTFDVEPNFWYTCSLLLLPILRAPPSPKTPIAIKQKAPSQIFSFYQNQKYFNAYF